MRQSKAKVEKSNPIKEYRELYDTLRETNGLEIK